MRKILFSFLLVLLFSFSFSLAATNTCVDGIDNDGDGDVDTEDVGCLNSNDISERVYGYQIALDPNLDTTVDASCLTQLQDSSVPYTKIAVADCVYQHYEEYAQLIDGIYGSLDSTTQSATENICLESNYTEYSSQCASEETVVEETLSEEESVVEEESLLATGSSCEDNSECASQFCEVGECVECSLDEHCASGEICDSNVCVEEATCTEDCGAYSCDEEADICYTSCDSNGACDSSAACVLSDNAGNGRVGECITCEDSDGDNYLELGSTTGVLYNTKHYVQRVDLCGSSDTVIEYVCKEVNGYTYVRYKDDGVGISCSSTYGSVYSCEDGACVGSASAGSEETVVEEAVSEEEEEETSTSQQSVPQETVEEEESLLAAGSSCEDNSECASQSCEVGNCAECSLDEHCASGEICDSNVCVEEATCTEDCGAYSCDEEADICYTSCDSNGACDSSAACVLSDNEGNGRVGECITCEDSDGDNYLELGSITGVWYNTKHYVQRVDLCGSSDTVIEYVCKEVNGYTYVRYK